MLVDTSVLIRTLQPNHPLHEPATTALQLIVERGQRIHIVPQNLVELWVVATRPLGENGLGLSPFEAIIELERIKGMFFLLPEIPALYPAWEALVTQHKVLGRPAHDARLAAAMRVHNITTVLTFDRTGFSRYPGIHVVDPRDICNTDASPLEA